MRFSIYLAICLILQFGCVAKDTLVKAKMDEKTKEILEKNAKAMKTENFKEVKSLIAEAKINLLKMNINGTIVTKQKDDKIHIQSNMANMEEVTAYDGKTAWSENLSTGMRNIEGAEKLTLISATLPFYLNPERFYDEIKLNREVQFNNKLCYEILLIKEGMDQTTLYIDSKTFLSIGEKRILTTPMGKIPVEAVINDYLEHEKGFLYPKSMTQSMMNMQISIILNDLKVNVEIDDKTFEKPAQ